MKTGTFTNRHRDFSLGSGILVICATVFGLTATLHAQTPQKRCDWVADSIPGSSGGGKACIDILALSAGNVAITLPSNTTRIGTEGLELCRNAFAETVGGGADVVFISDHSGSMWSTHLAGTGSATTYYYNDDNCNSSATSGAVNYTVLDDRRSRPGNTTRTAQRLNSGTGCTSFAGDPFNARSKLLRQAVDYMASISPLSTAGYVGFAANIMHPRAPLQLNVPANVQTVKDSMFLDSTGSTNYENPLRQAYTWFGTPSLMRTSKKAVVFLSDGAPTAGNHMAILDNAIPIYSIFLGNANSNVTELQNMSTQSGGLFFRVNPTDTTAMRTVMDSIIRTINTTSLPQSVTIRNGSTTPPQVSIADSISFNTDGNVSLSLDSIIGLRQGANAIQITVNYGDSSRNYNLTVNATGPAAGGTNSTVTCYDQPTLVMLRNGTTVDSVYPPGNSNYTIRLVRPTSELTSVTISAISRDTLRAGWGDDESVTLNQQSGGGTYQANGYPLNGSNSTPADGNGTLESDLDGILYLSWTNPRDSRETASYELPGRKISTFIDVVIIDRLNRYGSGPDISGPISDPVVARVGVVYTRDAAGNLVVNSPGTCILNCGGVPEFVTQGLLTPSFEIRTKAPISYSFFLYDHLGQFVFEASGAITAAMFQGIQKDTSGNAIVVFSIIPTTKSGQKGGTGVYILRGTIKTETIVTTDGQNNQIRVVGTTKRMIKQFGYLRKGE